MTARRAVLSACAALALGAAAAAGAAGSGAAGGGRTGRKRDPAEAAAARQRDVEERLARERAAAAQLARRESGLLNRLAEFERQIELEGGALRSAQARLRAADARLQTSEARARAADAQVARATRRLTPRLVARYRMGREQYVRFLLGARSVADVLRRRRLLTAVLEQDLDALDELRQRADRARAARDELALAREEKVRSAQTERQRQAVLDERLAQQRSALASIQQEKGVHEQAVRELEEAARDLSRTLAALQEHPPQRKTPEPPAAPPALPAAAAAPADGGAPQATAPAPVDSPSPAAPAGGSPLATAPAPPPADGGSPQAASLPVAAAALAPPAAVGGPAAPSTTAARRVAVAPAPRPEQPIRNLRGRLLFPVPAGEIETRFGRSKDPRFKTVTLQRGIDVRAPEGTVVRAVHGGTVVHAGWFRGYGNLLIVDHGSGMFSLMAHLATLDRAVGDAVRRGDRLGTVGESGSLKGSYLYFELRDGQTPLDPEPWLVRPQPAAKKG